MRETFPRTHVHAYTYIYRPIDSKNVLHITKPAKPMNSTGPGMDDCNGSDLLQERTRLECAGQGAAGRNE
jgi:hypothetical protein